MVGRESASAPGIGITYYLDNPAFLEAVLPLVDFIEVAPDALASLDTGSPRIPDETLKALRDVGSDARLIVHGVGLSIGSSDAWDETYLALLDQLFASVPIEWHSEHLGYTRVQGQFLGTMLPVPRTDEALELVASRAQALQARYGVLFLLEHVVGLLPDPPSSYSDAAFLNALVTASGCRLIVDAYNLRCDQANRGLDLDGFLSELDARNVAEVHVAGGTKYKGLALDVHSRVPSSETTTLAAALVESMPNVKSVTLEFLQDAIPTLTTEDITRELVTLRDQVTSVAFT
jgi:uncharacterized protein